MKTDHQGFLDPSVSLETCLWGDKASHPQVEVESDNPHHAKHPYWVHDTLQVYSFKIKVNYRKGKQLNIYYSLEPCSSMAHNSAVR